MDYFTFFTTDNKSGWKCRSDRLQRNEPEIFKQIQDFIITNPTLNQLSFVQQVYHFIFNLPEIPICPECKIKNPKFFDIKRGYQTFCSVTCSNRNENKQDKTKQTNIIKYGVTVAMQNPEIKEKIEEKNMENFGTKNPFSSELIKQKIKKTNKKKYGNEIASKSEHCKEKYKETCQEKYGVDSHWFDPEFKEKVKEVVKEKFGVENVFQNEGVKNKIKETNIEKYGVDNPAKSDKVYNKIKDTNLNRYGDTNILNLKRVKDKRNRTNTERYGTENIFTSPIFRQKYLLTTSKIETIVCETIGGTAKFNYGGKEYDIIKDNDVFEIDGDFFHPSTLNELTIIQIGTSINDKEKIDLLKDTEYNLYKVHVSDIDPDNITVENLKNNSYLPDHTILPFQKIMSKEYLNHYIETKGRDKLEKYVNLLLKFIRTFHPEFPYQVYNEGFEDVSKKIKKYDYNRVYDSESKTFKNNVFAVGCGYLKNKFSSFWKSKYNGNKTPVEMWYDDNIMRRIIAYRIGCNSSGEVFDFSIKELIKGISAIRGVVSFFKPIVAGCIYQHYLINHNNPVVFDPCCGFGGRLMGFKSLYPNGTYIGVEPNVDTYNELNQLSNNYSNIQLHNTKIEDFNEEITYDIAFTSIPYYNLEVYSNNIEYGSFEEWKSIFIDKLLTYPRLLINMSEELCIKLGLTQYIDTYLSNQTSHFDTSRKTKKEVIIKLNF